MSPETRTRLEGPLSLMLTVNRSTAQMVGPTRVQERTNTEPKNKNGFLTKSPKSLLTQGASRFELETCRSAVDRSTTELYAHCMQPCSICRYQYYHHTTMSCNTLQHIIGIGISCWFDISLRIQCPDWKVSCQQFSDHDGT